MFKCIEGVVGEDGELKLIKRRPLWEVLRENSTKSASREDKGSLVLVDGTYHSVNTLNIEEIMLNTQLAAEAFSEDPGMGNNNDSKIRGQVSTDSHGNDNEDPSGGTDPVRIIS
eukprot:GHVU01041935.1.p1 GENE.GHVU01041935.1~~GHVU01041935.1.p1  ORF type:complete len:114 (+),score=10.56 GHVU01041935.1:76-417(+)